MHMRLQSVLFTLVILLASAAAQQAKAEPVSKSDRPDKAVEDVVKANFPRIQSCINKYADKDATPKGKLVIIWDIKPDGGAANVKIETEQFKGTLIGKCYTNVIEGLKFPPPGKDVRPVRFPFFYSGKIAAAEPQGRSDDAAYSLDENQVLAVVKSASRPIKECMKRQAEKDPSLTGRMDVSWLILPGGNTTGIKVETEKFSGSVAAECIVKLVEGLQFPRFRGEPIPVKFPFNVKGM